MFGLYRSTIFMTIQKLEVRCKTRLLARMSSVVSIIPDSTGFYGHWRAVLPLQKKLKRCSDGRGWRAKRAAYQSGGQDMGGISCLTQFQVKVEKRRCEGFKSFCSSWNCRIARAWCKRPTRLCSMLAQSTLGSQRAFRHQTHQAVLFYPLKPAFSKNGIFFYPFT